MTSSHTPYIIRHMPSIIGLFPCFVNCVVWKCLRLHPHHDIVDTRRSIATTDGTRTETSLQYLNSCAMISCQATTPYAQKCRAFQPEWTKSREMPECNRVPPEQSLQANLASDEPAAEQSSNPDTISQGVTAEALTSVESTANKGNSWAN